MLQRPAASTTAVAKRGLAAAAAAVQHSPSSHVPKHTEVKTSRTSNGLTVTSIDRHNGLSRLAIAFRAGSRYEKDDQLGVTHRLRNCVGYSSQNHGTYELIWRSGLLGANVSAYTTRDLFVITMDAYRDYALPALEVLGEIAFRPVFNPWELHDSQREMKIERTLYKEQKALRCLDVLHRAAYRSGPLGRSIVSPKYMIGKHSTDMMQEFAREHLLSGEAAIVGVNVDHEQILSYAQHAPVVDGRAQNVPKGDYYGGQIDKQSGGPLAHIAIAGKAGGLNDAKASAVAAVYSALLSGGPPVKYSPTCGQGTASTHVAGALSSAPFGLTSIYSMNSDQGLAGLYIVTEAENAHKAVRAAAKAMKDASHGPSEKDLNRAKSIALAHALQRAESDNLLLEDAVTQALAGQSIHTDAETVKKLVSSVTQQDVASLAKQIYDKPSMASVGNVVNVPDVRELE